METCAPSPFVGAVIVNFNGLVASGPGKFVETEIRPRAPDGVKARTRRYDKDGKLEYGWDYLYDSFDNTIECVMYSWNSDQTLSTTMKTIAEFEYYESDN